MKKICSLKIFQNHKLNLEVFGKWMLRFASKVRVFAYCRHIQVRRHCRNDRCSNFGNNPDQMYPVDLRKKTTRQKATLLLLTSIYDKRDYFNFSISQTSRSREAIFCLCPPMVFLSYSLYDMPGHLHHMNVLFREPREFPISFSNRETSRNAWNRYWGSSMVDTWILSNNV